MKKLFSGLGVRVAALVASIASEVKQNFKRGKSFNAPESNPQRRSGKSSGGKGRWAPRDPVYKAWRKLFGGVAVPSYGFIDPSTPSLMYHRSSARGVRPYSFYKTQRA